MPRKPQLSAIKPKTYNSPDIRRQLYDAVDCVANGKSPAIGYAFVSFHKDNSFKTYWDVNNVGINPLDMPEAVKTRLLIKVAATCEHS